ncbi:MAG TPA: hypothetical protein VM802_22930 [Chitinophaga sp.]|uniref:hypothetical protein n=1 Tax=Chitinophaga sp. TaxID=1869181 RepID=UPI002BA1733C|nr:hypothetical protein [Chitinophaga sp.]HVI47745.1 hypothetical protein [Chitinophaga sp.]
MNSLKEGPEPQKKKVPDKPADTSGVPPSPLPPPPVLPPKKIRGDTDGNIDKWLGRFTVMLIYASTAAVVLIIICIILHLLPLSSSIFLLPDKLFAALLLGSTILLTALFAFLLRCFFPQLFKKQPPPHNREQK